MEAARQRLEAFRAEKRVKQLAEQEEQKKKEKEVLEQVEKAKPSPNLLEILFNIDFLQWLPAQQYQRFYAQNPKATLAVTFSIYLILQIFTYKCGFGAVFFIISIFLGIFLSLGQRKEGEASAYSVFNPGCERLAGQMTAEHFERDVIRRGL